LFGEANTSTVTVSGDEIEHQGEIPMLRTRQLLGGNAILAAALAAAPALAQTNDKPPNNTTPPAPTGARPNLLNTDRPATDADRLTEVQKSLDALRKDVAELKSLVDLRKEFTEFRTAMAPLANLPKSMDDLANILKAGAENRILKVDELRDQLAQLKTDVQGVRDRLRDSTRIAAYPPPEPSTSASAPAMGRVELINSYSLPVTIVVNQRRYDLMPAERRLTEPIPAGSYTYEVLGIAPLQTSVIAANTTRSIEVFPRP
jgi:hypothetical protein